MLDLSGMTDYDLAKSYLAGRDDCFTELIRRYKKLVFSVVTRMVSERELAEDLAQEIFIKIAQHINKYHPEFRFATWVMRISTNHCIDYRRKRRLESVSIEEAEFAIAAPEAESPEAAYLERERREMLDGLIDRLPEMYKTPIVLYHKDNLSYQEISEKTREPLSKVKNRIFRGRKMLKELLLMGKGTDAYAL